MNGINIKQKIWKLSFLCVGLGAILLFVGKMMGGSAGFYVDRLGLHSSGEIMDESIIRDEKMLDKFDSMEIDIDYADIEIIPADFYGVEYCVEGNRRSLVCEVQDGKFIFRKEIEIRVVNFDFHFGPFMTDEDYFVKIYIPEESDLSSVEIATEDGKIQIGKLRTDSLVIKNEYGDVYLDLENLADEYSFDLETEYGKIRVPGYNMSSDGDSMTYQTKKRNRTIKIRCEYGNIEIQEEK